MLTKEEDMILELFDEKQSRRTLHYVALIWAKHCRAIGLSQKSNNLFFWYEA